MSEVLVNIDDVVTYLREILPLSKPELVKLVKDSKDADKRNDIIANIVEQRFNPGAPKRRRWGQPWRATNTRVAKA
jgi:hypothetical protein